MTRYYTDNWNTYRSESRTKAIFKKIDNIMGNVKVTNYVGAIMTIVPLLLVLLK